MTHPGEKSQHVVMVSAIWRVNLLHVLLQPDKTLSCSKKLHHVSNAYTWEILLNLIIFNRQKVYGTQGSKIYTKALFFCSIASIKHNFFTKTKYHLQAPQLPSVICYWRNFVHLLRLIQISIGSENYLQITWLLSSERASLTYNLLIKFFASGGRFQWRQQFLWNLHHLVHVAEQHLKVTSGALK